MTAYKRLTLEDRIVIMNGLDSHLSLRSIANSLGRHPSSISREISSYRKELDTYALGAMRNRCVKRRECTRNDLCACSSTLCKKKKCAHCRKANCSAICKSYDEEICPKLSKPPYVCNGCSNKPKCSLRKQVYDAVEAHRKAEMTRSQSHSGMCLSEGELRELNDKLSPRLIKGQSIHHIFASSPDEFNICEKTCYTLVHANQIDARPIDLPRMVSFRLRKKSKEFKVDKKCRVGRTYDDFKSYMEDHPDQPVLQGDTVEGVKGGKCILTLTWTNAANFQLAFLRDHNDSASVTAIVNHLYESVGYECFHKVFPSVWLLDNGTEFSNPMEIEKYGIKVFYCDPSSPYQKGSCENTHENIRKVLPKGTSFDNLDQEFFDLLLSHCNGLLRKTFNDHSAYAVFNLMFGKDINIEEKLRIKYIPPKDIHLKPDLLREYLKNPGKFKDTVKKEVSI